MVKYFYINGSRRVQNPDCVDDRPKYKDKEKLLEKAKSIETSPRIAIVLEP